MLQISFFLLFVFIFWFIHILKRIFELTYIWQIKEYRFDRFLVFLRENSYRLIFNIENFVALGLTVTGFVLWANIHCKWLYVIILLGFSYYVYSTLTIITNFLIKKIKKPKVSVRNFLILGTCVSLYIIPIIVPYFFFSSIYSDYYKDTDKSSSQVVNIIDVFPKETETGVVSIPLETATVVLYFKYLFLFDLLVPLFVTILVFLTSIISFLSRKKRIFDAKRKVSKIENLKVIGITGSYGKTTTKEVLHLILSKKFKTYATLENVNSEIGVADTINHHLSLLADVFIVEMGAYKKGEIKAICNIVKPDIAIITAISEQHIALFKRLENILKTKYEIIENAKDNASVVLNGDNDLVLRLAGKSNRKEMFYSTRKELDVWASDIKSKEERIEFNVHHKGKTSRFEVKILGEHNVSNILAATSAALKLGMDLDEIAKALKEGSCTKHIGRLTLKESRFGYKVIDDSYNSNPNGFEASLNYLSNVKARKKILVTIGLIELSNRKEEIYERLAEEIIKVCDVLLTSDELLYKKVKGINANFQVVFDRGVNKQLKYLRNSVSKSDTVLFEGPNLRLIQEIVNKTG